VVVRGYSVMLGIHKQERRDTFDADGWYHTADRATSETVGCSSPAATRT